MFGATHGERDLNVEHPGHRRGQKDPGPADLLGLMQAVRDNLQEGRREQNSDLKAAVGAGAAPKKAEHHPEGHKGESLVHAALSRLQPVLNAGGGRA